MGVIDESEAKPSFAPPLIAGVDLSLFSIEELQERLEVLRAEMQRVEGMIVSKNASRAAADAIFKI